MPSGAYVIVDGQTYRVLQGSLEDVSSAVEAAVKDGSVLTLEVVATRSHAEGQGAGTLILHGGQLSSVAVLAGPMAVGGHPATG